MNQKSRVNFGILYPSKDENLYVYLLQKFKELSKFYDEEIILFTMEDLDLKKMTVKGTVISGSKLKQRLVAIPPFIYNITFHSKRLSINRMKQLRKLGICKTINPINTFNQTMILDILSSLPEIGPFIRSYSLFSPSSLERYFEENDFILIIPENEISRSSIIHVSKSGNEDEPIFHIVHNGIRIECSCESIFKELKKRMKGQNYLIMKGIPTLLWMNTL
ncbi:hypothetical protein CV093_15495 [Oceanobacillus sp. 143]|nr:hypothetical protein CV093_15495 [Oceanobacillus sp. 143]